MKINSNTKVTKTPSESNAKLTNAKQLLRKEINNFTDLINTAYSSKTVKSKDTHVKSKEIYYGKDGETFYSKTVMNDGSIRYSIDDASGYGRSIFVDLDGDGNIDKFSHFVYDNRGTHPDVRATDKDDNGNFDTIYY